MAKCGALHLLQFLTHAIGCFRSRVKTKMAPPMKEQNNANNDENKENSLSESAQNTTDGQKIIDSTKEELFTEKATDKSKNTTTKPRSRSKTQNVNKQNNNNNMSSANKSNATKKRPAAEIVKEVNKILGLNQDTSSLPKIPKLSRAQVIPAQAAGSSNAIPSDPIMHSTPRNNQVMYPYRAANQANINANQQSLDQIPHYLQDISNILPNSASFDQGQNMAQAPPQYQMANNNQAQGMVTAQFPFQYPQFQTPQYMGNPQQLQANSNMVMIPTPMYPSQPYVITDRNNVVTVPLGGAHTQVNPVAPPVIQQQQVAPPVYQQQQQPESQQILPIPQDEDYYEDYDYYDDQDGDLQVHQRADQDVNELLDESDPPSNMAKDQSAQNVDVQDANQNQPVIDDQDPLLDQQDDLQGQQPAQQILPQAPQNPDDAWLDEEGEHDEE